MTWRGGKLAFAEAAGQRDPAQAAPMKVDDLLCIHSMSKPIVGVERTGMLGRKSLELVDARRAMTVRDLMRHTSGVIEVASGQPLGLFLKARLFEPLGLQDTGFTAPEPERQARIAEALPSDGITGPALRELVYGAVG